MEEKKVKPEGEKNVKPIEKTLQSVPRWTWSILIGFCSLILLLGIINVLYKKHEEKKLKKQQAEIEDARQKATSKPALPAYYTKPYTLKKNDEPIRVPVPSGYNYTCTGGGKKYYHQAQNSQKDIWGDGRYHDSGKHIAYFELSYYDEEITVVCEFKRE